MVMLNRCGVRLWGVIFCTLFAVFSSASAEITARIDRPSADLNESFSLQVTVDTNTDMQPDLTVLDENFYRGQPRELIHTTIVKGQIRRNLSWTIALMAKSTGRQEIPAIAIGNQISQPLSIMINEPSDAPPGEADVFVTSEVDQTEAYVQSQILYRFKVYRAVTTRQEGWRNPDIAGVEVLLERGGDERSYDAILHGKAYNVIERVFAIYPQASGEITISPARFEARVLHDGRITGRKVFESQSHTVNVLPIPAAPADYPDAAWLPARDVQLSEEWSREPDKIAAGEPVSRKVTISALGQIETQIPELMLPVVEGMNVYADKPDLTRLYEVEGIRGVRRDQYAMIGVRGGTAQIPALEVPWWDIQAREWRIARLPARTIEVEALEAKALLPPPVALTTESNAGVSDSGDVAAGLVSGRFWKKVSELIAVLWLLTVFAWWWSRREKKSGPRDVQPPPIYKRQAKSVKAARKAVSAGDMAGVRTALIEWGRLQWPNDAPRSIGSLAARVAPPLSDELKKLSALSYGSDTPAWDTGKLAKLLSTISVRAEDQTLEAENPLPPLMPR